jgi:hypothetical protein
MMSNSISPKKCVYDIVFIPCPISSDVMTYFGLTACSAVYYHAGSSLMIFSGACGTGIKQTKWPMQNTSKYVKRKLIPCQFTFKTVREVQQQ